MGRAHAESERWISARARFLGDPAIHRWVRRAQRLADTDGALARRLVLLDRLYLDAASEQHPSVVQLRLRLERRVVGFRPRFQGRRVDRARIRDELRTNPRRAAREEAYRAEDELWNRLGPDLRRLTRARNARARALGFPNYPELRLSFEGLTVAALRNLCDEALRPIAGEIRQIRDDFIAHSGEATWFPWDLRFAQERRAALPYRSFPGSAMVPAIRSALRRWGLPISRLPIAVTMHDIPFGGLTFAIRIPTDVRIVIPPKGGWERYLVAFHEFGHAVHFASIHQPGYLLRSPDVGFSGFVEGIGDLFEEVSMAPRWLQGRRGVNSRSVRRFRKGRSLEHLVRAAMMTSWVRTELDLYRDPDGDPTRSSTSYLRTLFGFGRYAPRSFIQTPYITHPVYGQSYLLSLLFRKQLVRAFTEQVGRPLWPNPAMGPWLVENWLAPGARYDWIPRVWEVTGRPFGVRAFQDSVRSGEP